jgi:hypothetical protein
MQQCLLAEHGRQMMPRCLDLWSMSGHTLVSPQFILSDTLLQYQVIRKFLH